MHQQCLSCMVIDWRDPGHSLAWSHTRPPPSPPRSYRFWPWFLPFSRTGNHHCTILWTAPPLFVAAGGSSRRIRRGLLRPCRGRSRWRWEWPAFPRVECWWVSTIWLTRCCISYIRKKGYNEHSGILCKRKPWIPDIPSFSHVSLFKLLVCSFKIITI